MNSGVDRKELLFNIFTKHTTRKTNQVFLFQKETEKWKAKLKYNVVMLNIFQKNFFEEKKKFLLIPVSEMTSS